MFENLGDFSFQRSRRQAIGFYLVWLAASAVITALIVDIYIRFFSGAPIPKGTSVAGVWRTLQSIAPGVVPFVIMAYSMVLTFVVLRAKKAYNRVGVACVVLTAVFSVVVGLPLSIVPAAYLTTLPKKAVS